MNNFLEFICKNRIENQILTFEIRKFGRVEQFLVLTLKIFAHVICTLVRMFVSLCSKHI